MVSQTQNTTRVRRLVASLETNLVEFRRMKEQGNPNAQILYRDNVANCLSQLERYDLKIIPMLRSKISSAYQEIGIVGVVQ